ncbi:porin [Glaciimonas sp. PAMC28666]|uniref:porin n=1 Tax=Glaciimonas sp. PAMC28666 TaxID=2807626 RepID=UPI0019644971|nr:porin [Glaciimonas sp. PAMC28666]QRX81766.1 porin [Glaciimonas sp. PAMC28666]
MKRILIALAALSVVASAVQAQSQSSVTIYGKVDLGLTKFAGDSANVNNAVQMQQNHQSRVGFMGVEDLGGGLSALFQMENRFTADDGVQNGGMESTGPYLVGLKGSFGTVKLGRNWNTIGNADSPSVDPFEGDGIGGLNALTLPRLNNTVTYYSPAVHGFGIETQYIFSEQPTSHIANQYNDGYTVAGSYDNGPIHLSAGYGEAANSNNSVNWGAAGTYIIGAAKIIIAYDQYDDKTAANLPVSTNFIVATTYAIGNGLIKAAYNQTKYGGDNTITNTGLHQKFQKVAIGYQHKLSKRTSLYADIARTKFTDPGISNAVTGVGAGITQSF